MKRSGLAYSHQLEQWLCARWWGYRPEEWEELDAETQATCIAVYRCDAQMTAVVEEYHKP